MKSTGIDGEQKLNYVYNRDNTFQPKKVNMALVLKEIKSISQSVVAKISNENASLEICGSLTKPTANGHLVLNPRGVDIRYFPGGIERVEVETKEGLNKVKFICNKDIIHSIYFNSEKPLSFPSSNIPMKPVKQWAETHESIEELWRNMQDVHHIFQILEKKKLKKIDALRALPKDLAYQVTKESISQILKFSQKEELMIFVGNQSAVQIYSGKSEKIIEPGSYKGLKNWVVHGKTREGEKVICKFSSTAVAEVYVINKFSLAETVTSVEVFDDKGEQIIQFNGFRLEGKPQTDSWKTLIKKLPAATDEVFNACQIM